MSKQTTNTQLVLGLAVAPITRCVSMCRVEVFVPAELMDLPECLEAAFDGKLRDLDAPCNTVSVYYADIHRDLRPEEVEALKIAERQYGAFYRVFKR
jgi:hypothetical protein